MEDKSYIPFESQASYSLLDFANVEIKPKPDNIPELFFGNLPEYVTSDEEDEDNYHQQ